MGFRRNPGSFNAKLEDAKYVIFRYLVPGYRNCASWKWTLEQSFHMTKNFYIFMKSWLVQKNPYHGLVWKTALYNLGGICIIPCLFQRTAWQSRSFSSEVHGNGLVYDGLGNWEGTKGVNIPSGKLTWQWKNSHFQQEIHLQKVHCPASYVSLPECNHVNLRGLTPATFPRFPFPPRKKASMAGLIKRWWWLRIPEKKALFSSDELLYFDV